MRRYEISAKVRQDDTWIDESLFLEAESSDDAIERAEAALDEEEDFRLEGISFDSATCLVCEEKILDEETANRFENCCCRQCQAMLYDDLRTELSIDMIRDQDEIPCWQGGYNELH